MENKQLRVLVVDDSPDDAELPIRTLRDTGYRVKSQRVYNLAGMESMLQKEPWDIILSEFTLLQFGAQMALDLLKRKDLDTPLLVLTRSISDSDFANIIAAGARDVIRKNYSTRLVPAIERELDVVRLKRQLRAAQERVAEMEGQNSAIVSGTQEAVCYCHDGMHIKANRAYLSMFGYSGMDELETVPILNLVDPKNQGEFKNYLKKAARNQAPDTPLELAAIRKGGELLHVSARFSTVQLNGEDCIQITFDDISQRKATEDRLQYLTQRDPLTGLYNRLSFGKHLSHAWRAAHEGKTGTTLIYFNLLKLREINSAYGYTVGDSILLKISKALRERLGEGVLLARFGEHEFTALVDGNSVDQVKTFASDFEKHAHDLGTRAGHKKVHCDIVSAVVPLDASLVDGQEAVSRALAQCADARGESELAAAMATTSSSASPSADGEAAPPPTIDMPTVSNPGITEGAAPANAAEAASEAPMDMDGRIDAALANDGFRLVYQPIVSLAGETDELFEVLVRMVGESGELISPREFMPAAQQSGKIAAIDEWVAQRTMESLDALRKDGRQVVYFVNVSVASLKQEKLAPLIVDGLKQRNLDPRYLVLEFSQNDIADHIDELTTFAREMKKAGCRLSIDNAGEITEIVTRLPAQAVRYVKFDGKVVQELMKSGETETLDSTLETARQLSIRTIATHIEDAESLSEIWSRGFDYVQGHYFQQPESELTYEFNTGDEATLATDESGAPPWSLS
jgi:diguanylate cyclase (GGDEF)-like protein/PAS domain S-box-containing protein